ncbi:MAG: SCO family protein [Kordia sp.]|nr:MAG: SCO family protein [Kordia sp.]
MLEFFKVYKKFAIFFLFLSAIILTLFYYALKPVKRLPIWSPGKNVNLELVDSTVSHIKKLHYIADFSLTNQNGETITQDNYKDKIYVADFFFTTCKSICPVMTSNMKRIQQATLLDNDIMLLSHTEMPEIDTVAQLKRYALEKGVLSDKWNLVTGSKKELYNLARKSYLVAKYDPSKEDGYGFIHTENFVLVDKKKRIRGLYDGTNEEEIDRLLEDIQILKEERKPRFSIGKLFFAD